MKFEETIQCMLDFDGDLFPTRKHCLRYLFCKIGTGYEWESGELVSDSYDELLKRWTLSADFETAQEDRERVELFLNYTLPKLKLLTKEKLREEYRFWGFSSKDRPKLIAYPDDIKEDWLKGVMECVQSLKADGIDVELEQMGSEGQGMNLKL